MADTKTNAPNSETRKLRQAEDGKRAMKEYQTAADAERAKTARLKAARLARDAEIAAQPPVPTPPKSTKAKAKGKAKPKAASLSNFLSKQSDGGHNG